MHFLNKPKKDEAVEAAIAQRRRNRTKSFLS
jgi:hypothetical protein